jgi:hypothetical protein
MSEQYRDVPIPVRAPGPDEDTDDVEQQFSATVDEDVDALYDRGQGARDRGDDLGRENDDTAGDSDDVDDTDDDDAADELRGDIDEVSDRVRQAINADDA